jgi:hypothetical protein
MEHEALNFKASSLGWVFNIVAAIPHITKLRFVAHLVATSFNYLPAWLLWSLELGGEPKSVHASLILPSSSSYKQHWGIAWNEHSSVYHHIVRRSTTEEDVVHVYKHWLCPWCHTTTVVDHKSQEQRLHAIDWSKLKLKQPTTKTWEKRKKPLQRMPPREGLPDCLEIWPVQKHAILNSNINILSREL